MDQKDRKYTAMALFSFFFFFNVLHAICSIKINKCYSQDCLLCIAPTATGGHFTETNHHLQLQTKKIFILIKR